MAVKKVRAAILGFGGMGHCHAAQYAKQKNVRLVAVCDIDQKQLETAEMSINLGNTGKTDMSSLNKYLSYGELIKNEALDFIDICLPTDLHAEYSIRALKDGFNVLCEKPMALNVRDCDKMIAAAEKSGKLLMIAQCLRFNRDFEYVRETVKNGSLGKLIRLSLHRAGGMPGGWFRDVSRSGGALMDLHIHDLDYVLSLLGKPQYVACFGNTIKSGGIDDLTANMVYADGVTVGAESSWARGTFNGTMSAMFEQGTIELGCGLKIYRIDQPTEEVKFDVKNDNMYFNEIAYFAECVKNKVQPERCLPASTRETIRMIIEEIRSANAGGKKIIIK